MAVEELVVDRHVRDQRQVLRLDVLGGNNGRLIQRTDIRSP
jgi:hypothetical protein